MRFLFTLLLLVVIVAVVIWSGIFNIAAVSSPSSVERWLFAQARDRSIAKRSQGIQPPSLKDPALIQSGFREYHAMCFGCHSAPGHPPSEIAQGLNPSPPLLDEGEIQVRSDMELFWIIKNGIRMTGMPAFGPTHKDETLWSVVAFLRRLRTIRAQEYKGMVEATGVSAEAGHSHAEGVTHQHEPATQPVPEP